MVMLAVTPVFCMLVVTRPAAALSPLGLVRQMVAPVEQLVAPVAPVVAPVAPPAPAAQQSPTTPTASPSAGAAPAPAKSASGEGADMPVVSSVAAAPPAPLDTLRPIEVAGLHSPKSAVVTTRGFGTTPGWPLYGAHGDGTFLQASSHGWKIMGTGWYWWVGGGIVGLTVLHRWYRNRTIRRKSLVS